jgi:hypothetical protein
LSGESASGLVLELGSRKYLLPFDRVAFVAPLRKVESGMLVMPRGRLPLVDPRPRLGLPAGEPPRSAVAIRGRLGFFALSVDSVDLFSGAEPDLPELDPLDLVPEDDERSLFEAS